MFKAIRIAILLLVLLFVGVNSLLTQARSTDWNNSLWLTVYPINADGSAASAEYIASLDAGEFAGIERFLAREAERYGRRLDRPVRIELGGEIHEQPPALDGSPGKLDIVLWSLRLRWWANSVTDDGDRPRPDVRMFVRYHAPADGFRLDNSVGLQKGMVGVVNGFAGRAQRGENNLVIAHEFLHTLGATDKYDVATGQPLYPSGYAEPGRSPRHPQRRAEIMGGRVPVSDSDAVVPDGLADVVIGPETAVEIRLR